MQAEISKTPFNGSTKLSKDSLKVGVYCIYDTVLKQYDLPISIPISRIYDYMSILVNDVQSKFYGHEDDYILNKIGEFNSETGEIKLHFVERVNLLSAYIDKQKRQLQTIAQVLNYLPSGYYKMPVEQQKSIQEKIDNAVMTYVSNYVIPDLDISKFDVNKVRDIYSRYDEIVKTPQHG